MLQYFHKLKGCIFMGSSDFIKTKFAGIYYKEDTQSKVKTYFARINIRGLINTEQIVGYSNDSIRTTPSIAYQKRIELIQKIKRGDSVRVEDNQTLDKYFKEYLESKKNNKTLSKNRVNIYLYFYNKHLPQYLKAKKLKQIVREDFQKVVDTMIKKEYKVSYVELIKSCFSPFFNDSIEKNYCEKNIIKGLKFPKYDENRYFDLDDEKVKLLVKEIANIEDKQYKVMFMFLLRGRRAGEVLSLDWSNINLENKNYSIMDSQSKIRKTLTFSIDDELLEHIQTLGVKKEGLVFISNRTGKKFVNFPRKLFNRMKKKCGITDMKLHDFRHLLGLTLVNNNVPLESIQRALGHSKITTTQRYSNQKEKMAKEAVDVFLGIVKAD